MSIPGLGQIPAQPPPGSRTRTITLKPLWEWRFESPHHPSASFASAGTSTSAALTVRLVSGTAERDGTELALNVPYTLQGAKSKILTWKGCTLEVSGECEDYVAEHASPDESPQVSYLNLHFALQGRRRAAAAAAAAAASGAGATLGPRVLVCGGPCSGKTSLARTLAALATRQGGQPILAGADPREAFFSLPGTLGAAAVGTVMDVEAADGGAGVGASPSSGPGPVPVKLPLVHYFGRDRVEEDPDVWRALVAALGAAVGGRLAEDGAVRAAGLVVDAPTVAAGKSGVDLLAHIVSEFAVNIVVVLGSARLNAELQRRLSQEQTRFGEAITVLALDKSEGVAERDEGFMQQVREAAIKEYFFGDAKRTLSPFTQQVDFSTVAIYKIPDPSDYLADEEVLEKVDPISEMSHWTLAVMNASPTDPIETIRYATVMGFVYVSEVDQDRQRLKILAPVSGRLGDRPLIWGRWPEPYINLLG